MDELNNQIIDECKDLKEEEFIYTINEFLEMYNEEKDNIYMLLEYNIWLSPINGNENIELNFDNGIDLYLNVSDDPDMYKNFEVHIYKMEYEKINDITENISDFIYSLDEEKQEIIGIYLTDYYLMCYKDINDVEDERYEYISFINNSNEEEILDKFHNDMDFRTVILEDYIHEIYQSYQDEKTNDIYTLSYYLRSNILKLVEDTCEKYSLKDEDKREFNIPKYEF